MIIHRKVKIANMLNSFEKQKLANSGYGVSKTIIFYSIPYK
jgi:hypothetical protein